MLFSYYLCFPVMLALSTFLVACATWECFWWCVRPENDFDRACVRPENDFGRVLNLRKIFVVCSTRKCLGRMLTATERLILALLSIWKRFGLVSDLRQILAMCTTCGRFLLEYSTWQRRFILCSVLGKSLVVCMFDLGKSLVLCHIFCCYIFCWAFFSFPPLPWPEGRSTVLPITRLRMGSWSGRVSGCYPWGRPTLIRLPNLLE